MIKKPMKISFNRTKFSYEGTLFKVNFAVSWKELFTGYTYDGLATKTQENGVNSTSSTYNTFGSVVGEKLLAHNL